MAAKKQGPSTIAIPALVLMAVLTAIISGASFEVIKVWPLPASVVPGLSLGGGIIWGLIVGAISGLVLGFCTDDIHFTPKQDQ
ncbi:MAG: hypothetical protein J0H83_07605 [Candidatus Melainabacteria bacterium]|jgi:uncharacterized membrane protein|nr:hypothetical protein [Candidatus Melainabacteria bacterium]MBX9673993.1 hypothetical protein [Candidatus Obscuribacterales bacterium]